MTNTRVFHAKSFCAATSAAATVGNVPSGAAHAPERGRATSGSRVSARPITTLPASRIAWANSSASPTEYWPRSWNSQSNTTTLAPAALQ